MSKSKYTRTGIIKYDSKHDSYFIQIEPHLIITLFCFVILDEYINRAVRVTYNSMNEALKLDFKEVNYE